ncbi:MAG: hypothetical protein KDK45_00260 [Leptospiraceae bacterium]|nr:hypothetical protein [Leptospiraceae bacterium]
MELLTILLLIATLLFVFLYLYLLLMKERDELLVKLLDSKKEVNELYEQATSDIDSFGETIQMMKDEINRLRRRAGEELIP